MDCFKEFATRALTAGLVMSSVWPVACVETGNSDHDAAGGRGTIVNETGGASAGAGGNNATLGGCGASVDTTGDGTAGTTSTGPYRWKSVTIRGGGFVDGIIFSPIKKGLVYARTDMGGAYRYDETNHGWVPLTDWVPRTNNNWIGIESIAADPVDPNVVYLAVGTYLTAGNGAILRSNDAGSTFTSYPIAAPMGGNTDGRSMGERLAIDPNLTSTLYFGSRAQGLFRSTDSGSTWSVVSSFPVLGGITSNGTALGLSFVLFDPKSGAAGSASSTIYVGVADVTAGSNLYVSNDAGSTWQLIEGGPTGQMPHHGVLDAAGKLTIAYNDGPGPNNIKVGGVWKYDIRANQWSNISPSTHGIGGISLDATNPDTLVAATLDWWAPDEIYRTTDGGAHWSAIGNSSNHNPNGAVWLHWGLAGCALPHDSGWMGDIEIDPFDSDHVMYVTGQGVWSTNTASAAAFRDRTWTFDNRNLEQTAVTDMMPSVNGAFLSCVGDIAGMRHEDLDRPSPTGMYNKPISGNCTSIDFAASDPTIVVRAGNPDSSNPSAYGGFSRDNGQTWTVFPTLPLGASSCSGGGKLAVSADGSTVLWSIRCTPAGAGATQTIAVSPDFGSTWTPAAGVPTNASIAADRKNPSKFYAYANTNNAGVVYLSTDGGKNFSAVSNAVALPSRGIIRPVFGIEGDIWIVANSALYHSTQSGAEVAPVAVGAAYAIGFGKAAEGKPYPTVYMIGQVDGAQGFFRSEDAGATWTRIDDATHQFATAGYVAGDENIAGRVYIGTNGRGILYGDPN